MTDVRPPLRIEPLRSDRLDLTPLDPAADAPDLHEMLADPEVHRYDNDAHASETIQETESRLRLQVVANGGATWAIRLRGGPAIGTIGVFADQGTRIRGVGWSLASSYWQRGFTSEAARVVVPYLLGQDGVDGLEAWVDSRNHASIGVAQAAGMTERGRLPRVYADHAAQTVVMARAARPRDPEVFGIFSTLRVTDLESTLSLLTGLLELHVAWAYPDPPTVAFLAVAPWSGSPGFQIEQAPGATVQPQRMSFDVGITVDEVGARVRAAGLEVVEPPRDQPWVRREMTFQLPDGHRIGVSGPTMPRE
jgi:ribosomal-protein-alanine N-acetyltransferase